MNKQRYRIIFNAVRGIMMVVAEFVKSHTGAGKIKDSVNSEQHGDKGGSDKQASVTLAIRPMTFSLLFALGQLSFILPNPLNLGLAQAEVLADPNAPKSQQPVVLRSGNGIEVVNIRTPNAKGFSYNAYQKFDVTKQGVIMNNSRTSVQTQLGGWIGGNSYIVNPAKVIFNQVNSSHPSYLKGFIEIAGGRAEFVLVNPNGINCDGCGFINAYRATLTTGTPIFSGGDLAGYRVHGGDINIIGDGLDASNTNYTDIIARAVNINAGVWADNLAITTGTNQVNAGNTQITAIDPATINPTSPIPASGYALDVAALGGMYAKKITMIGTEAGLGVHNAGNIGASVGNITMTSNGQIINAGSIIANADNTIQTSGGSINNSGTLYAQGNTHLGTQQDIDNTGLVAAQGNTTLTANGSNGQINSSANAILAAGLKSDGTLIAAGSGTGNLNMQATQGILALGQNLAAGDQTLTARELDLSGSDTLAHNLNLTAGTGDIQAANAIIHANQTLTAGTTKNLNTNGAAITAHQLNLSAHDLSNVSGELVQTGTGDTVINLAGNLDNTQGRIATNSGNLTLAAQTLTNISNNGYQASIEHAGIGTLTINADTVQGTAGQIISNGALNLTATTANLNQGSTIAKQVTIATATLNNQSGEIIQTGIDDSSITATNKLDNSGGMIASNGNTTLTVGELDNRGAVIQAAGAANLTINATGKVNNSMLNALGGSIQAGGALTITADHLDNTQSEITASNTLNITTNTNSSGLQNAQGLIASNQALTLNTASLNNSDGTVASVHNDATITARAGSINNSAGQISAAQHLNTVSHGIANTGGSLIADSANIDTQLQTLDNTSGNITANTALDLQTGALINDTGLIQSGGNLIINTHGQTLTNSNSGNIKGILAIGSSTLTTGNLNNQTGYIGARGAITANSAVINNNTGSMMSEAAVTLNGTSLDNQSGSVEALGNVAVNVSNDIDNRNGLLRSGQALTLTAASIDNRNTQNAENGIEGVSVTIDADQIDNSSGAIRADNLLAITGSETLNNSQGTLSSTGTLNIVDRLADANSNVNTKTLNITNTGGTIIAGTALNIDTLSLTGDGKVLSQGDLSTKLTTDYTHSGEWQADGNATLTTTGNLTNQAKLLAGGNLDITAANLDNQATGEIAGANLNLSVADTLNNRGLLDGGDTFIHSTTLNNIGTGRIYGDHVAIATGTLNNVEETVNAITQAAVIAARDRLDIGAETITNQNDALIFSAGDMAIGGALDSNHQATVGVGQLQSQTFINNGATIEALGNLQLSVSDLQNINSQLVTDEVLVATGSFHRFTPRGRSEVLNADDYPLWKIGNFNISWRYGSTYGLPFNFREYYRYLGTTSTTETQVVSSNPGQIMSGGYLQIQGTLKNSDSEIVAGGILDISGASLQNLSSEGQNVKKYNGKAYYYDYDGNESCGDPGDGCYDISYIGVYRPADEVTTFNLDISRLEQNASFTGTNTQVAALNTGTVTQQAVGTQQTNVSINGGSYTSVNTQVPQISTITQSGTGTVIGSVNPNTQLPNNSLFHPNPNPTGSYLIETDPRFANYRNWLSSDYMLKALNYDPAGTTKRLGDGFYEQKLIREQVAQLTGKRFLTSYVNDEQQYQALMINGATFAQAHQLIPGVALTEAQIAQLTADIVWLVEKTITLPDGSTVQALVPQVYIRLQPGDINGTGSLLAGENIQLNIEGDLINSGTIAGRSLTSISADNINNLKGRISGNITALNANTDINNLGGSIEARDALILQAGHDINIASTTQSSRNSAGVSSFTRTNLDRVAGLYVSDPSGILVAAANNNINLQAAQISNSGSGGTTLIDAGNNLNLSTLSTAEQNNTIKNSKNYIKYGSTQEIGSNIQTEGNLTLNAGHDLTARAAVVTGESGSLTANAGNNLTIESGVATSNLSAARTTKKSGTFSSKKTERRDSFNNTDVISSTFSGNEVNLNANNDISIKGSNVVGTQDVNLNAGNNITLDSVQATHDESHYYKEKKSGFSASSTSVGYGKSKLQTTNDTQTVTNIGSTIGSVEGDVNINAGKQYTQTGSDVLTPQGDINITAQQVDINSATDTYANQQTMKYKQSGITLSVGSSALNLAQNVVGTAQGALTSDSNRNKALNALQTYANGATLKDQATGIVNAAKAGNIADAASAGGVKISLSIGTSSAKSNSSTNITTQQDSLVKAGGNVNIKATQEDITVKGSQIEADKNITLEAAKNLNLIASADTESNQSKNKSSNTSIGLSVGVGSKGAGLSVDLAASRGKGSANSDSTTYNNTHVTAGETLTLHSGNDTNMIGANAAGKEVIANVGGDLNIQSLQDTATSRAKQSNTGISVSVPVASPTLGNTFGAVSQSKQKSNSNYASVYEQSGIKADDQGFNITTKGNTDLKGAVIESTATADKNNLTTGTLTTSNIENHMQAEASSSSTTLSTDMLKSKYAGIKGVASNLQNHGEADVSDSSSTSSAIAPANIQITDDKKQQQLTGKTAEETVAALNRDTTNTNRVLAKPDVQALQEKVQQEQTDRMLLVKTITTFTDESFKKMFLTKTKMFEVQRDKNGEVIKDADGKPIMRELSDAEKINLKANGDNQKLNIFTNGIFNDESAAGNYAEQMTQAPAGEKVYLVYYPEANNFLSELMIAAYQKSLENSTLGLSNTTQEIVNLAKIYGQDGLNLTVHSRGAMTVGNALEVLKEMDSGQDVLSGTNIKFVGPAYSAKDAANSLNTLSGGKQNIVQLQNHLDDFVGRIIGGNEATYGETPEGSSLIKEWINMFGASPTVHSCYGNGDAAGLCGKKYGDPVTVNVPANNNMSGVEK